MEFLLVLGEGVEGAFLRECEAANLLFPPQVVNKIWQGVGSGLRDIVAKKVKTQLIFEGALGCKTLADGCHSFFFLGQGVKGAFLKECEAAYFLFPKRVVNQIFARVSVWV